MLDGGSSREELLGWAQRLAWWPQTISCRKSSPIILQMCHLREGLGEMVRG
jgi:hypothetical protein